MVGLSPTTFWSLAQPQQWPTMYFAERDPHKPRHDFVDLRTSHEKRKLLFQSKRKNTP